MSQLEDNKDVYRRFIDILNRKELDELPEVLDVGAYQEVCVGAYPGWMDYEMAINSVRGVIASMPDVNVRIDECIAEGDTVFARCTVSGTNTGPMMGMPASNKAFEAYMFDYAKLRDGHIVERIQMADNAGIMQQLSGGMPGQG